MVTEVTTPAKAPLPNLKPVDLTLPKRFPLFRERKSLETPV